LNLYFCLSSLPLWGLTKNLSFQWNEMQRLFALSRKNKLFLEFGCLDPSYADAWCKLKIYMLVYIIKHPLLKSTWTMFENTNKNEWEYSMVWLCAILSIFYWSNLWSKLNFKMLLVYIVLGLLVSMLLTIMPQSCFFEDAYKNVLFLVTHQLRYERICICMLPNISYLYHTHDSIDLELTKSPLMSHHWWNNYLSENIIWYN
jgi:hypothetical protein